MCSIRGHKQFSVYEVSLYLYLKEKQTEQDMTAFVMGNKNEHWAIHKMVLPWFVLLPMI